MNLSNVSTENLKAELQKRGYCTDHIWGVSDVPVDNPETAMDILNSALSSEYISGEIRGEIDNLARPHNRITFKDGFVWEKISMEEAEDLVQIGLPVYGLNVNEETESLIEDLSELGNFEVWAVEVNNK